MALCNRRDTNSNYIRVDKMAGSIFLGGCMTLLPMCIIASSQQTNNTTDYTVWGDLMKLSPTGASAVTAAFDGFQAGVEASNAMIDMDMTELNKRKSYYVDIGDKYSVEPALIAALASRESRGGTLLYETNGYGDHGKAYGIMQADLQHSGLGARATAYAWDSKKHMDMLVKDVLLIKIKSVQEKLPDWTKEQQLQGGVAAYNGGIENVQTWENVDLGTTGNDYSNDVIARAQHLKNHYGW